MRQVVFGLCLIGLVINLCAAETMTQKQYTTELNSLKHYQVPEWYQDAKFGIWPHWGVYSVPAYRGDHAAEWYGIWMHSLEKEP